MAEITKSIVDHLTTRLESLTLDSPKVRAKLKHDGGTKPGTDSKALDTEFRRFRWRFPVKATPTPVHVGTSEFHPRIWDLPLSLTISYPFGGAVNQETVGGMALDDSMRIVHHLEVDHTRVTVAGVYEWVGVLVEAGEMTVTDDRIEVPYTVTAKFQRTF